MKKKIREQINWIGICIIGLLFLWICPTAVIADSTTVYPVTTKAISYEYNVDSLTDEQFQNIKNEFKLYGSPTATWSSNQWAVLTPAQNNAIGSMYYKEKLNLDHNFSVSGKLAVDIAVVSSRNADGFSVILSKDPVGTLGNGSSGIGVVGLHNSVALVFDTYQNTGEPATPYLGIWSTDSNGNKSVKKTEAISTSSGYSEFTYSFNYDAASHSITYTFNGKTIYQATIDNGDYYFSIAATTSNRAGSRSQYARIGSFTVPKLVTNTPIVKNEVRSTYSSTLTLADENGTAYPTGSTATVNGKVYTVDDTSSISVPFGQTANETNLKISVKSYQMDNNTKLEAMESETITYTRNQQLWGDVPWSFDSSTGTITFTSGGTLGPFYESPWNRSDALRISNTAVKKIVFTSPVSTQAEAGYLFGGFKTQTDGQQTAYSLQNLTTIEGLTYLDTSNARSMTGMFLYASSLTSLDLSKFNTSKVTSMRDMFAVASGLTSLNLSSFDTSQVTDMANMFQSTSSLTSLNLSSFKTSKVTSIYSFLSGASKLTNVDITSFDTSKVTDMSNMFSGMSSLTSLDLTNFDNTTLNPNINRALADTKSLKSITLGPKFKDTSNASALPNITVNDTYSGNWQYQVDESIVGTTSQFLANYDGTKPGTYVWGPATVTMTVNYLDAVDKKPIFEDALQTSTTKTAVTKTVKTGATISDQFSATDLAFDGYRTITSDSYTTGTSNTQEYTTVPTKNFSITYSYTPMTKLISVPNEFSFGNFDPRDLLAKETVVYPTNSPIENVKILNTNRTVQWVLSAQLSSDVQRESDNLALKGYVFYQTTDKEKKKITIDSATQLATQSTSTPLQQFVTVLGNSIDNVGIGMDIFNTQRNYLGNYTGKIDWVLTTKNK